MRTDPLAHASACSALFASLRDQFSTTTVDKRYAARATSGFSAASDASNRRRFTSART